jgi:broad specificity phosphatase PhoE
VAGIDGDLVEWNYGDYEGLTTAQIHANRPDWELFRDGCPGGESPAQVVARADNLLNRLRAVKGDVLLFTSGHFIRVFAARWIGLEPSIHSMSFLLSTASLSAVGYDRDFGRPVIRFWNDTHHVRTNGSTKFSSLSQIGSEAVAESGCRDLAGYGVQSGLATSNK